MASKVQGVRQTRALMRKLALIDPKLPDQLVVKALRKGANVVARDARGRVDQRTGRTRKSITVRKATRSQRARGRGRVYIGNKWPQGAAAILLEFGTAPRYQASTGRFTGQMPARPFMRPALEARAADAARAVFDGLAEAIEAAAEKVGQGWKPKRRRRMRGKPYRFVPGMRPMKRFPTRSRR